MRILLSYSCVITTVWLHNFDLKHLEKKLHGNYTEMLHAILQILEAAPNKTASVQLLTSHLINHPRHAGNSWWSKDKLRSDVFLMDSYAWTHQCGLTSKILLSSVLYRHWMQSRVFIKRDGERESQRDSYCWHALIIMMIYIYDT